MTDLYKNKYRIPSTRLQNWDYGWNAPYFITICTKNRELFFGEIADGQMILSDIGLLAEKCFMEIPSHFSFIELDAFVIMPNHVHGILVINKKNIIVKTWQCLVSSDESVDIGSETRQCLVSTVGQKRLRKQGKNTLSSIVGSYKSVVSKHAHRVMPDFAWQSRFHDHIIRNNSEFDRIRNYITENPKNWKNDKFNYEK